MCDCLFEGFVYFDEFGKYCMDIVMMVGMLGEEDWIIVMDGNNNVGGDLWVVMFMVMVV